MIWCVWYHLAIIHSRIKGELELKHYKPNEQSCQQTTHEESTGGMSLLSQGKSTTEIIYVSSYSVSETLHRQHALVTCRCIIVSSCYYHCYSIATAIMDCTMGIVLYYGTLGCMCLTPGDGSATTTSTWYRKLWHISHLLYKNFDTHNLHLLIVTCLHAWYQFSLHLSHSKMTINKAQRQTFNKTDIYMEQP